MNISFSTLPGNLLTTVGYGVAGFNMVLSLQALGHKVPYQDPTAPVQIHFSQPTWYEFDNPDQYKIGYTPWESTALPTGWLEDFNAIDELWTPSDIVAEWFKDAGVEVPIKVYEHGIPYEIDGGERVQVWTPKRRKPKSVLRFLHHGEPAGRKAGQLALDAFKEAFGDQTDVHLTFKSHGASTVRAYDGRYRPGANFYGDGMPQNMYKNVSLNSKVMEVGELVTFIKSQDVLVYPSWGEGFGLIPLQAMATGMPTICTEAWAPYKRFLLPELALKSRLVDSPWTEEHPGKMFEPNFDDLVECYHRAYNDFDRLAGRAFTKSFQVHEEYAWDKLTEKAFSHIVTKFS